MEKSSFNGKECLVGDKASSVIYVRQIEELSQFWESCIKGYQFYAWGSGAEENP